MSKTKELREAFVAGALYESNVLMGKNVSGDVGGEAIRRYPAKTTTRLKEITLLSRNAAAITSRYRLNTVSGELQVWNEGAWRRWMDTKDAVKLRELLNNPWETVEVEDE